MIQQMNEMSAIIKEWLHADILERLLLIVVGVGLILLVKGIINRTLNKNIKSTDNKYRARKAIGFISYILMVMVVLLAYNDKLGNIGITLGVIGAGIAFALQEVIISLAAWLNIMVTGVISVGQRVKIGEIKGDIIDIGVLSTVVMEVGDWIDGDLYNGRIVTLANSFVFKESVHNYSAEYPFLWDEIQIPIRTESDFHLARTVFKKVLDEVCLEYTAESKSKWHQLTNKYRVEEAQVEPMISLKFDENWITFTLRYVVDYKKRRSTKDIIYSKLLDEINQYENIIMIATSSMEITNVSNKVKGE